MRVEQLLHFLRRSEGQAGRADLRGEILCVERLVAGHGEQIKRRLLAVAEKEVLADGAVERFADGGAVLHRGGGVVLKADVGDTEGVERGKDRADALVGNGGSSRVDGGEVHEEAFFLSR